MDSLKDIGRSAIERLQIVVDEDRTTMRGLRSDGVPLKVAIVRTAKDRESRAASRENAHARKGLLASKVCSFARVS